MLRRMLEGLKTIWARWKGVAHWLMKAQTTVLVFLAYWIAVGPVGLLTKVSGRDLLDRGRGPSEGSLFGPMDAADADVQRAQRQF